MLNGVAPGVSYESAFIDGPLDGLGFAAALGDPYGVFNIKDNGFDGIPREFFPIIAGLGSVDLLTPRDIGGIPMEPRAVVVHGPVSMDSRPYFNFNTDWNDVNPDLSGPVGADDFGTKAYLAYLNSQLQPLTQIQSAEAFANGL